MLVTSLVHTYCINAGNLANPFWMSDLCRSHAIVPFKRDVTLKTVKKSPQARLSFLGLTKSMLKMAAVKRSGNATYWNVSVSMHRFWVFLSYSRRSFGSGS
jgi:hypothetical protein